MKLHPSQSAALEYVTRHARSRREAARRTLSEVGAMCNLSPESVALGIASIKQHARIALSFHPDRLDTELRTVAEGLRESGLYKSQFETFISNGSVSAFPSGPRDQWEERLYGGAYQAEGVAPAHRPKYGALDLLRHPDGPSPRFGSCYFLLSPEVSTRATFTYLDSHQEPPEKGTYEEFDDVVAALFAESFSRDFAIGEPVLSPGRLLDRLLDLSQPFVDPSVRPAWRNLNHYIEAQVHGDVRLREDVDVLVMDPSFRGTDTGATLQALCQRYAIEPYYHAGFVLSVEDVPGDFRGPTMPSLAAEVASDGLVDAAAIGRAAAAARREPDAFAHRGSLADVLQELKLLWHVLVRFGHAY